MKTVLHTYSFDTDKPEDREPYYQLKTMLEKTPGRGHKMHALKTNHDFEPQPGEIELEAEFLFQNQWNSNVGRVFDWYEEAVWSCGKERKNIKRGHYLEITPEMVSIRQHTLKCGYTGQQFPDTVTPRLNTTQQALGSPYLKESELHLLRLLPVCEEWTTQRKPLTKEESDFLLPLYIAAQTKTDAKERDKQREKVISDYDKAIAIAETKRKGYLWLLDHGMQIENCIFYDHVGQFSFGWRNPYTGKAREALIELLKEFPFSHEVK